MAVRFRVVNFGQSNGGLTTVGYTLFKPDGTMQAARSTAGVVEFGTSTGIYGAKFDIEIQTELLLIWDTGGAVPRYAMEENSPTLAFIQEETDHIRLIWNTLKNQGEIFTKIFKLLKKLEKSKSYDDEFKKVMHDLNTLVEREYIHLKDIKEALHVNVKAPSLKIPTPRIERKDIDEIKAMVDGIGNITVPAPAGLNIINDNIKLLGQALQQILENMPTDALLKEHADLMRAESEQGRQGRLKKVLGV